jgi:hypothetical protein
MIDGSDAGEIENRTLRGAIALQTQVPGFQPDCGVWSVAVSASAGSIGFRAKRSRLVESRDDCG